MSLKEKLDRRRAHFRETAPPEALAVMDAATKSLVDSNLASEILGEDETLPEFELPNVEGATVRSFELLSHGKLVRWPSALF